MLSSCPTRGRAYVRVGSRGVVPSIGRKRAQTRLPGATDLTQYGEGRASTKAFLTHHVANISTVVQAADRRRPHRVLSAAVSRAQRLSHGFA